MCERGDRAMENLNRQNKERYWGGTKRGEVEGTKMGDCQLVDGIDIEIQSVPTPLSNRKEDVAAHTYQPLYVIMQELNGLVCSYLSKTVNAMIFGALLSHLNYTIEAVSYPVQRFFLPQVLTLTFCTLTK